MAFESLNDFVSFVATNTTYSFCVDQYGENPAKGVAKMVIDTHLSIGSTRITLLFSDAMLTSVEVSTTSNTGCISSRSGRASGAVYDTDGFMFYKKVRGAGSGDPCVVSINPNGDVRWL